MAKRPRKVLGVSSDPLEYEVSRIYAQVWVGLGWLQHCHRSRRDGFTRMCPLVAPALRVGKIVIIHVRMSSFNEFFVQWPPNDALSIPLSALGRDCTIVSCTVLNGFPYMRLERHAAQTGSDWFFPRLPMRCRKLFRYFGRRGL